MGKTAFEGAYIPADGSYGLRLELTGERFLPLWRNAPVLDTTFTVSEKDGKVLLIPEETGLRSRISEEPYATLTEVSAENGQLILRELFPISGESVTAMAFTEYSRYGRVTVENEKVLPMLRGCWKDERGFCKLRFDGDSIQVNDQKDHIAAVRYIGETKERYRIVNKDPSKDYIAFLTPFDLEGSILSANIPVCDAEPIRLTFVKTGK